MSLTCVWLGLSLGLDGQQRCHCDDTLPEMSEPKVFVFAMLVEVETNVVAGELFEQQQLLRIRIIVTLFAEVNGYPPRSPNPMSRAFVAMMALLIVGASTASEPDKVGTVTFTRDVAPILQKSCISCHRPGEIGPMPLTSYSEARPWAKAIREAVAGRKMPPW